MNSGKPCHHVCPLTDSRLRSCTLVSHIWDPDSLCPFKLREDVPEDKKCDPDFEDDDSVPDMVHKYRYWMSSKSCYVGSLTAVMLSHASDVCASFPRTSIRRR